MPKKPSTPLGRTEKLALYCDGLRLWAGDDDVHPAVAGTAPVRIRKLRRRLKRLGLGPSKAFSESRGCGLFVSLAPFAGRPPLDLKDRAAGRAHPRDLRAVSEALFARREYQRTRKGFRLTAPLLARVTGVHIAMDVLGYDAYLAKRTLLPSIGHNMADEAGDMIRLRGWRQLPASPQRDRGAWFEYKNTSYARRRLQGRDPRVNLVVYSHRPSKLEPDGPPVLHVELRLRGNAVPKRLRADPMSLPKFLAERGLLRLFGRHVEMAQ